MAKDEDEEWEKRLKKSNTRICFVRFHFLIVFSAHLYSYIYFWKLKKKRKKPQKNWIFFLGTQQIQFHISILPFVKWIWWVRNLIADWRQWWPYWFYLHLSTWVKSKEHLAILMIKYFQYPGIKSPRLPSYLWSSKQKPTITTTTTKKEKENGEKKKKTLTTLIETYSYM